MLPDAAAGQIEWHLSYRDLTDAEVLNLSNLFVASRGGFDAFTFIDPLANLLGWSENLSQPDWQAGLLQTQGSVADPVGTLRAWTVTNGTSGVQTLTQTLGISGNYVACFSLWVRSNAVGAFTLARDGHQISATIGPVWTRIWVSGAGTSAAAQSTFSLLIGAGQSIDVFGLQIEAQPHPSAYKPTVASIGIYEETYFGTDELKVTSEGVGFSSCAITLISRV